jgi:hypothetical protein
VIVSFFSGLTAFCMSDLHDWVGREYSNPARLDRAISDAAVDNVRFATPLRITQPAHPTPGRVRERRFGH